MVQIVHATLNVVAFLFVIAIISAENVWGVLIKMFLTGLTLWAFFDLLVTLHILKPGF